MGRGLCADHAAPRPVRSPRIEEGSTPRCSVLRVAVLAAHDEHSDASAIFTADNRVGEVLQRVNAPWSIARCAQSRELDQELHHALELVEKAAREPGPAFLPIEAGRFEQIEFRVAM